jgi:hypothetical protein
MPGIGTRLEVRFTERLLISREPSLDLLQKLVEGGGDPPKNGHVTKMFSETKVL